METEKFVLTEKRNHIFYITLNRPEVLNALSHDLFIQFHDAIEAYSEDDDAFVAIITGNGRAFSSGADLKDMIATRSPEENLARKKVSRKKGDSIAFTQECWKPLIAGVHGLALGGGFETAISCDVIVAASDARLGLPEAKRGIVPGIGMYKLSPQFPLKVAMEIMLTGEDRFPVQRAYELGLVNKVVPVEPGWSDAEKKAAVLAACEEIAQRMTQCAPLALQAIKKAAIRSRHVPLREAMHLDFSNEVFGTEDAKEGPTAFAEKRAPVWKGY